MSWLGRQWIVELLGCDPDLLERRERAREALLEAADAMGATVVDENFRQFEPHGVSGVVVISESHLTVHTWPEYGYAAVDVFTCDDDVDLGAAVDYLEDALDAETVEREELVRGPSEKRGDSGERAAVRAIETGGPGD